MYQPRLITTLFCSFILLFFLSTCKSTHPEYHRIKIMTDEVGIGKLSGLGLAMDHGDVRKGVYFIGDFKCDEVRKIKDAGFEFDCLIKDVKKHYKEQNE